MNDHSTKSSPVVTPMAMNIRMSKNFRRSSGRTNSSSNQFRDTRHSSFTNPSRPSAYRGTRTPSSGFSRSMQCNYCHRIGHLERECRTKQRETRPQSRFQPRAQARIAQLDEHNPATYSETDDRIPLQLFTVTIEMHNPSDDEWYFDIGATHHMTFNKNWLMNYTDLTHPLEVRLSDDSAQYAQGFGSIQIHLPNGQNTLIDKVYFVPALTRNLLSVSEATKNGSVIEFHHQHCIFHFILSTGYTISLTCKQRGRLYPLGISTGPAQARTAVTQTTSQMETLRWHYRLGHPHINVL